MRSKEELLNEFRVFQSRSLTHQSPEQAIRYRIDGAERALRRVNREFSGIFDTGSPEALAACRTKAVELETLIADLHRVLEGGVVGDSHHQAVCEEAVQLQREIFEAGLELKRRAESQEEIVEMARQSFLDAVAKRGELTREAAALATVVSELERWAGRNWQCNPGALVPRPLQDRFYKLAVGSEDLSRAFGANGVMR